MIKSILFAAGISGSLIAAAQSPSFQFTPTCFGSQTTLVASSSLPDTSIAAWQWDLDTNGTYELSGKTIIWLFTSNDTVPVRLKITPKSGAADSVTSNVIIDPLPQVNFMANNLCETQSATYISTSTIASGSIGQFLWDFNNDGNVDDNSNDTVNYTCGPAQTYITKLICVSNKGCSAFSQKVTTVYALPTAGFTSSGNNSCDSILFNNTTTITNPDFYIWNFGDGNSITTPGNASHVYPSAGSYSVSLVAISQQGCRDTAVATLTVTAVPMATFSVSNTCVGENSSFAVTSAPVNGNYIWDFGDGNTAGTNGNADHSFEFAGTYSVQLTVVSAAGCADSSTQSVTIYPKPSAILQFTGDTILFPGQSVTMTVAGGSFNYTWNTGETVNSITITPSSSASYYCHVTDINGCWAHLTAEIIVNSVPDTVTVAGFIITPNDDQINDVFLIQNIEAYQNCDLEIYNLWNDKVFSVKGYQNDWKGKDGGGAELPAGAYYYVIRCDDKPMIKGNINILR